MANPVTFPGDVIVPGNLRVNGSIQPAKDRDDILAMVELATYTVPWTLWRVWDAMQTNLPGTAATDDLALIGGTWATGVPSIQTLDFGAGTTTAYARAQIPLPAEYVAGQTVTLRFHAGMVTAISDDDCNLDVVCYKSDEEFLVDGADLCTTAAQDINSMTFADIDFTITPASLSPGDLLDVRVEMEGTDVATAVTIGCIGAVQLLCDVR